MTHPFAASAVKAAARDTGATANWKHSLKRDNYSRAGTVACRFVLLSHEMFGRAGPATFALLNEIAEFAASSGVASKRNLVEHAMRGLSTTLCRGITRQVLATVPLCARLNGHPVVAGLPVPTDDLIVVADASEHCRRTRTARCRPAASFQPVIDSDICIGAAKGITEQTVHGNYIDIDTLCSREINRPL